jgi:hypothetical protein
MIITINNTSSTNPSHLNTYAKRIEIIIINANTVNARLRFLSGLEIDFKAFKKDKRARQGQNDDESSIPGHLH